jgi:Zn-dependent protease with chaperone function
LLAGVRVEQALALDNLSRDELQAVIGHEFSHILNEDLTFNSQLAGVVQGFQMITKLGDTLTDRRLRSSRDRGGAAALGIGLVIIGAIGYSLGRLIQSLFSQQREYLADASSAQFTRNPQALARALGKILMGQGSAIRASSCLEYAHIFFSDAMGTGLLNSILKTHPRPIDRINRLVGEKSAEEILAQVSLPAPAQDTAEKPKTKSIDPQWTAEKVLQCIGAPNAANFNQVATLISELGTKKELLRKPAVAKAAFSLVVLHSQAQYEEGLDIVIEQAGISKLEISELRKAVESDEQKRVLLFQTTLSALRELSLKEKQDLLTSLKALFERDHKWSLLETMLYLVAEKTLLPGRKLPKTAIKPAEQILKYYQNEENVDFIEVQNFLFAWNQAPLLQKKTLLENTLTKIDLNKMQSREEFRLMSLWLGVPVPLL